MAKFQIGDVLKDKRRTYKHKLRIVKVLPYEYWFQFIMPNGTFESERTGTDSIEIVDKLWYKIPMPNYNNIWDTLNGF